MGMGRPKAELTLSTAEQEQLTSFARSRSMPAALSLRARIVLACAAGQSNTEVARRFESTNATVDPTAVRTHIAALIHKTLHKKPKDGSTHWSVRTAAADSGISKSSVQRYFQVFGLKPHRTKNFKLSNDAFFIEKLRAVVGLYLNPPENAMRKVSAKRLSARSRCCRWDSVMWRESRMTINAMARRPCLPLWIFKTAPY